MLCTYASVDLLYFMLPPTHLTCDQVLLYQKFCCRTSVRKIYIKELLIYKTLYCI